MPIDKLVINMTTVNELLEKLGFTAEEIKALHEENTDLKHVLAVDVLQILKYLEKQGLKVSEMINMAKANPWVLVESFERIDYLEKYYKMIGIEGEVYKELLIKWPISISLNPIHVKQEIERQREIGRTDEQIREDFFVNFDKHFSI